MLLNIDTQIASALRSHTKFPERGAIILQQLKFWLSAPNSGVTIDGIKWIWNSVRDWQKQFTWLSKAQIRFTLNELEELGFIQSTHFSEGKRATNRSKLYTLCSNRLEALISPICDTVANAFAMTSQMHLLPESKSIINNNQYLLTEKPCVCSGEEKAIEPGTEANKEKAIEPGIETREEWPAIQVAIAKLDVDPEDKNLKKLCEDKFSALGQKAAAEIIGNAVQAVQQIKILREPPIAALKSAIAGEWKPMPQMQKSTVADSQFRTESPKAASETIASRCNSGDWLDDAGNPKQEFILWKAQRILADPPFKRQFSDIYAAIAYLKAEVWASFNGTAKLAAHWEEYLSAIAHRIGTGALCAASGGSSAAWKPDELAVHADNVMEPASDPTVESSKRLALTSGFAAESNPIKLLNRALPSENSGAYKLFSSAPVEHHEKPLDETECLPSALIVGNPEKPLVEIVPPTLAERIKRMLNCGAIAKSLITKFIDSLAADERGKAIALLATDERGRKIADAIELNVMRSPRS